MTLTATAASLLVWLALSIAIPKLLGVKGANQWILSASLALIGVIAAGVVLWWMERKKKQSPEAGSAPADLDPADELSQLLRDAESKLSSAKQLSRGTRFGNIPVVLLIGPANTGKTTAFVQGGVEPELLAGRVYQDTQIAPTRIANFWFAKEALFVEPATAVLADNKRWLALIRRLRPGRLTATVNRGAQAPRAAVVVLDCETAQGSVEKMTATARGLHEQLSEVSRHLGIALPVYVLFTKADRLPFFLDYFRNLQDPEPKQLLGAGLPAPAYGAKGSYEELQSAAITDAFDGIYYSLAEHRIEFLAREADANAPAGYEFPREFRKLRDSVVQFLVALCRPSQLSVGPFLRGFYFTGVRPVAITEAVRAPERPAAHSPAAGATAIFRPGLLRPAQAAAPEYITKRVPQWAFLKSFFTDVVLADDAGLRESGASIKVNLLRRVLLSLAIAVCALLLACATVSFFKNRALETDVRVAAAGVASQSGVDAVPSLDSLQRLDRLRTSLAKISTYNREGAPLSYRWGLYIGNDLLAPARALYFARFRQLLLDGIQVVWLHKLRSLPQAPAPNADYGDPYNTLESYLITTSNHDKSSVDFLSPELMKAWSGGKNIDADRTALARKQLDFYASELKYENPYSPNNDTDSITHARHYLGQFTGIERVYRNMVAEVSKGNPSLNFNQKFPGSSAVVVDSFDVPGAYTKSGFAAMMDAINHASRYFTGAEWVLGNQSVPVADVPKLQSDLKNRYFTDYIGGWRKYIQAAHVVGYSSIPDAANKLKANSQSLSPLLGMMCLAAQNTDVGAPVATAFATLHKVVSPGCSTGYIGQSNADYMKNLAGLQLALEQIGTQKPDAADPLVAAAANSATAAKTSMISLAQSLGVDPEAHLESKLQTLLSDPIVGTDPLLRGLGPGALNGKGAGLCADMRPVLAKYPFNAQSPQEASLPEINALFKPGDGSLWKFYDANLAKFLTRSGEPIPGAGFSFTPRFLAFFRRAAGFANAAYSVGTQDPKIDFTLRPVPNSDLQSLKLTVDGVTVDFPADSPEAHKFSWPGATQGVTLSGTSKTTGTFTRPYDGLWAVFRFFGDANRTPPAGIGVYEWDQNFGAAQRTLFVVKFDLGMGGAPAVFQKGYFSGMNCVSEIASAR